LERVVVVKSRIGIACILAVLFALPIVSNAWVDRRAPGRVSNTTENPSDSNNRDKNKVVRGWSTTVVVQPPISSYYYNYGGYQPPSPYPYVYGYPYQSEPWGYDGPPVILPGDRYDSALVWDQARQGFRWDTIVPSVTDHRGPTAVFNPNAVVPKPKSYETPYTPPPAPAVKSDDTSPSGGSVEDTVPIKPKTEVVEAPPTVGTWDKRGLVSSINRSDMQITIITPQGPVVIDARDAKVVKTGFLSSLAAINEGDAVKVNADLSGLNKVKAYRIEITSSKDRDMAETTLLPTRIKGKIVSINYPSFTFKMETDSGSIRVLAAEDAKISSPDAAVKAFMDIKLGQTVKIVAIGSLSSGYAASEVVIVP
jgi:hypothetical protein